MTIKDSLFFLICFFPLSVMAYDSNTPQQTTNFQTTEQILATAHNESPTPCASEIFSNALYQHANEVSDTDDEARVRLWAQNVMMAPDVLETVLKCPEIEKIKEDTKTITFTPILFEFANKTRNLIINYSTQKKVLKQKIILSKKRSLPDGNPNPKLMDENDPAIYINTNPAWYAIMVVQHDSLSKFVGEGKNNTLSMKWIHDNIDSIYPHGYRCTSKSALTVGNNQDAINQVVHKIVDIENDSNDYYVAGDVNLEWVMYAEIALEVAITVATVGIGEGALIGMKSARAAKTSFRLSRNAAKLSRFKHVSEYAKHIDNISSLSKQIERNGKNIKNAKKYEQSLQKIETARKSGKNASKYEQEAKNILAEAKQIDPTITPDKLKDAKKMASDTEKLTKQLNDLEKQTPEILEKNHKLLNEAKENLNKVSKNTNSKKIQEYKKLQLELDKIRDSKDYNVVSKKATKPELQKRINDIEKVLKEYENSDDFKDYAKYYNEVTDLESVDDYANTVETLKKVREYRGKIEAFKTRPQTGNIITKNLERIKNTGKTLKAANSGAKMMGKARRIARAGMSSRSAKIGDWLFDTTLKHGARLARIYRDTGLVYGAIVFLGDMYDYTSADTDEFTNGIEFKPLGLLSADDLTGQENVVNYGMWLLWEGNSTDPADDDAAYLQAMDFASKFYYQLDEYQDEHGAQCNVDIYVVRPIIRVDETNPNKPSGELYYLFMNDIPWSTADQISNVSDWERAQQKLIQTDPDGKYIKTKATTE